jgi:hypothetical protein
MSCPNDVCLQNKTKVKRLCLVNELEGQETINRMIIDVHVTKNRLPSQIKRIAKGKKKDKYKASETSTQESVNPVRKVAKHKDKVNAIETDFFWCSECGHNG